VSCGLRSAVQLTASLARHDPAVPLPSISGDWFFYWNNGPVLTAAVVKEWLAARGYRLLEPPTHSTVLVPVDLIHFSEMKEEQTDCQIAAGDFKKTWVGVSTTLEKDDVATAFWRWLDRREKCVDNGNSHVV